MIIFFFFYFTTDYNLSEIWYRREWESILPGIVMMVIYDKRENIDKKKIWGNSMELEIQTK